MILNTIQDALKVRGAKSLLKRLCKNSCKYVGASGARHSSDMLCDGYYLEISRDSSYKDEFYLSLIKWGEEDEDYVIVDELRFHCRNAAHAYVKIKEFA